MEDKYIGYNKEANNKVMLKFKENTIFEKLYINTNYVFDVMFTTETEWIKDINGNNLYLNYIVATKINNSTEVYIMLHVGKNEQDNMAYDENIRNFENSEEIKKEILNFLNKHINDISYVNEDKYIIVNGISYNKETPNEVIEVLETGIKEGKRFRLFYGDKVTGKDWLEENDTIGYIGKSMGKSKIPILLKNKISSGGCAILSHCIVKITIDKKEVYKHNNYHIGDITKKYMGINYEYPYRLFVNNENVANFQTDEQMNNYINFIKGNRNKR